MANKRFSEQYYGIVFGFRIKGAGGYDGTSEDYFIQENEQLVSTFNKPPYIGSPNGEWGFLINKMLEILNKTDQYMITYHDGVADKSCEYNGKHWHVMVKLRCHPTRDARWGRQLLDFCKPRADKIFFACQTVNSVPALARHILTQPRRLVAKKGMELEQFITSAGDDGFPKIVPDDRAKIGQDKNYHRIKYLMELMRQYRTSDINAVKAKIVRDPVAWETFSECVSSGNYDVICKKAAELYRTTVCHLTLEEIFDNPDNDWRSDIKFLSFQESSKLFEKWIQHNNFNLTQFISNIFDVLKRKTPKVNTFCLQGPPNSGKSYVLRSLVQWFQFFGEVRGGANYNFLWQDCLDTALIFIEEPYITPEIVEQCKLVFEGAATKVHVKMRGDAELKPTPVFITCNNVPWRWCGGEEGALRARMHYYNCKEAPFLRDEKKYLSPFLWPYLFEQYKQYNNDINLINELNDIDWDEDLDEGKDTCDCGDNEPPKKKCKIDNQHYQILSHTDEITPAKCDCYEEEDIITIPDTPDSPTISTPGSDFWKYPYGNPNSPTTEKQSEDNWQATKRACPWIPATANSFDDLSLTQIRQVMAEISQKTAEDEAAALATNQQWTIESTTPEPIKSNQEYVEKHMCSCPWAGVHANLHSCDLTCANQLGCPNLSIKDCGCPEMCKDCDYE